MTPSGHTLSAQPAPQSQEIPMPTTNHGIIVGVDGSPAARVAVDWAAREASLRNLPLTLIHVIPWATLGMWPGLPMPGDLEAQFEKHGREVLSHAVRTVEDATKRSGSIEVETELVTAAVVPT